jgi:ankyrin repeat protein
MRKADKDLLAACELGDIKGAKNALSLGANPNCKNVWHYEGGPITAAAMYGKIEILKLLIENGAKIKKHGGAALLEAIKQGDKDMTEILLKAGAPLKNKEDTASRTAAIHGNTDIMNLLIEHGADILKDKEPFFSACTTGEDKMVEFLIAQGLDIEELKEDALFSICNVGFDGQPKNNQKTANVILKYFSTAELKKILKMEIHPQIKIVSKKLINRELGKRNIKKSIKTLEEKTLEI